MAYHFFLLLSLLLLSKSLSEKIVFYDFLRADCLNGSFPQKSTHSNVLLTDLILNKFNGACPQHNGIKLTSSTTTTNLEDDGEAAAVTSSINLSALLSHLKNKNTFTFDFWIDNRNNNNENNENENQAQQDDEQQSTGVPQSLLSFTSTSPTSTCNSFQISQLPFRNSSNARRLSSSGLDLNSDGGELDVVLCNQQESQLHLYSQGSSNSLSTPSFLYYTISLTFTQSIYSPTPKTSIPIYVVEMNSTTRSLPASIESSQSSLYYDFDLSLSGNFHPSRLLNTQAMGTDTYLSLLPHSSLIERKFSGTLLSMSIYDQALTSQEINQNLLAGLSNSLPVLWNKLFVINEDGQSEESLQQHYGNPLYNDHLPCQDLQVLSLPLVDVDDDPSHPNYLLHNEANSYQSSLILLLTLPRHGVLYRDDGECELQDELGLSSLIQRGVDGKYLVKYRPHANQHSQSDNDIFDSFLIRGIDGISAKESLEVANITIIVKPVNDAPIATSALSSRVYSQVFTKITLTGSDIDTFSHFSPLQLGSNLLRARIHSLPTHGFLYLTSSNSSASNSSILLTNSSSFPLDLSSPYSLYYQHTSTLVSNTHNNPSDLVGNDSFLFEVEDTAHVFSLPVVYHIDVLSSLGGVANLTHTTTTSSALLTIQSEMSSINIYGYDFSDTSRDLRIQILKFPQQGELYDLSSLSTPLSSTSSFLSMPMELIPCSSIGVSFPQDVAYSKIRCGKASLGYLSNSSFFSLPNVDWNGTTLFSSDRRDRFSYSVVDLLVVNNSLTDHVISTSPELEMLIDVLNLNQPTTITFNYQREDWKSLNSIQINSYQTTNNDPFNFTSVSSTELSSCLAKINGFTIIDPDLNLNIIRVEITISSSQSYISLNSAHLEGVIFNSNLYCFTSPQWSCMGDGFFDYYMTFVGTPSAIEKVLNGMEYLSLRSHHTDHINITLYDGMDGSCLTSNALLSPPHPHSHHDFSIQRGCYKSSISLQIVVLDYFNDPDSSNNPKKSSKNPFFFSRVVLIAIAVVILLLILLISALYNHCILPLRRCISRKKGLNSSLPVVATSSPAPAPSTLPSSTTKGPCFLLTCKKILSCCCFCSSTLDLEQQEMNSNNVQLERWMASEEISEDESEPEPKFGEEEDNEVEDDIVESEEVVVFTHDSCRRSSHCVDIETG